jgi:anti-sigma regulatory factor (Ser/Thr protein kinase)
MSLVAARAVLDQEIPPVLESVPYARDLVAHRVPPARRREVSLVVSELVANAVKHGSGPIGLRVEVHADHVHIAVRDACSTPPAARDGYGLRIVEQLAARSGVEHHAGGGKTVWADVA